MVKRLFVCVCAGGGQSAKRETVYANPRYRLESYVPS